jgi:hypothetical protein
LRLCNQLCDRLCSQLCSGEECIREKPVEKKARHRDSVHMAWTPMQKPVCTLRREMRTEKISRRKNEKSSTLKVLARRLKKIEPAVLSGVKLGLHYKR